MGTPVTVVNQPVKLGWHEGKLYLEVNPTLDQFDALEMTGGFEPGLDEDIEQRVRDAAGSEAARLQWPVIRATIKRQYGVPVQITR